MPNWWCVERIYYTDAACTTLDTSFYGNPDYEVIDGVSLGAFLGKSPDAIHVGDSACYAMGDGTSRKFIVLTGPVPSLVPPDNLVCPPVYCIHAQVWGGPDCSGDPMFDQYVCQPGRGYPEPCTFVWMGWLETDTVVAGPYAEMGTGFMDPPGTCFSDPDSPCYYQFG